jgi:hypothetical protein
MGNMVLPFIDRDLLHKSAFNGGSIVYKQEQFSECWHTLDKSLIKPEKNKI